MRISIRTKLILLLFFLISIAIALISGQAYKIALKDMSNNAKANTRIYAKNSSNLIEERLQMIKEKALFAVINESIIPKGSELIFERSPAVLAVVEYFFPSKGSPPERQDILINPNYQKKYPITKDSFDNFERNVDFKTTLKDHESLNVGRLPNYPSEILIYAFPIKITGVEGIHVFVATLIPDLILTAIDTGRSKYINYLIDNTGRILVHPDSSQLNKNISRLPFFKDFFSKDILGERTLEYVDENNEEVIGSFFRIKRSNLGIVSKIPSKNAYAEAEKLKVVLAMTAVFAFIVSLIIALYFARSLISPLLKLSTITGEIAKGNFLVEVDIRSRDEIGDLAGSFKKMGTELHVREEKLNEAQAALVQSEKMSAFGQISAGIAHEVKNPLTGILGHAQLAREKIRKKSSQEDLDGSLGIIEKETKRCKTIIENLMMFARQEKAQMAPEDLSKVVRDAITLVDHQLTIGGVKIVQEIPDGFPPIFVSVNQIEQVLMNLMLNTQHAMKDSVEKKLTVRVMQGKPGFGRIEVEDTGTGMPEDVRRRVFEPFFTTKPSGKGTGLGLSVSYGIIQEHKGVIDVESKEGVGTTFIIELPYKDAGALAEEVKPEVKPAMEGPPAPAPTVEGEAKPEVTPEAPPKPPLPEIKPTVTKEAEPLESVPKPDREGIKRSTRVDITRPKRK